MFLTRINSALHVCVCCSICKNPHKSGQIMLISKEFLPCVNFVLLVHQEASVSQIHFCRPQPILLVYQLKIPDLRCTLNINSLQYWKRNVNCSNGIVRAVRTHYCRILLRSKACMLCPSREVEEKLCETKVSVPEELLEKWHFKYLLFKADRQVYISKCLESNAFFFNMGRFSFLASM